MKAWAVETIDGIGGLLAVLAILVISLAFCVVFHPIVSGWWTWQCFKEKDPDWKKFSTFFFQGIVFLACFVLIVILPWPGKFLALLPAVLYIAVGNDMFDAIDEKQQYGMIGH
ncbi:MAG: hypothetical protein Q8O49_01045 [bacterium]|nr:hypothetical protein [bacterium]